MNRAPVSQRVPSTVSLRSLARRRASVTYRAVGVDVACGSRGGFAVETHRYASRWGRAAFSGAFGVTTWGTSWPTTIVCRRLGPSDDGLVNERRLDCSTDGEPVATHTTIAHVSARSVVMMKIMMMGMIRSVLVLVQAPVVSLVSCVVAVACEAAA